MFVAGDASRDAQFVVVAAAEGVKAAVAINKALQRRGTSMTLKAVTAAGTTAVATTSERRRRAKPAAAETSVRMPVDIRSVALTVLAAIAVVLMLQYAQAMIIPIVLGVLISYALEPIVSAMERRRIPRSVGAALLLMVLVGAGGWLLYGLRSEASAIVEQLPQAARRLRQTLGERPADDREGDRAGAEGGHRAAESRRRRGAAAAGAGVQRVQVEAAPFDVGEYLMYGSLGIAAAAGQLVLILFLVYFLLASGDLYRRKLVKIAGPSLTQEENHRCRS